MTGSVQHWVDGILQEQARTALGGRAVAAGPNRQRPCRARTNRLGSGSNAGSRADDPSRVRQRLGSHSSWGPRTRDSLRLPGTSSDRSHGVRKEALLLGHGLVQFGRTPMLFPGSSSVLSRSRGLQSTAMACGYCAPHNAPSPGSAGSFPAPLRPTLRLRQALRATGRSPKRAAGLGCECPQPCRGRCPDSKWSGQGR